MRNTPFSIVAWWLWYRGTDFAGYQAQIGQRTVQSELLRVFAEVGLDRNPVVAGRTDKGVHARMQVLSSRVRDADISGVKDAVNARLPADMRVHLLKPVAAGFSAPWSASGKEYRYRLREPGDLELLREAASLIPGTRNFRVFHFKSSAEKERTVEGVELLPEDVGVTLRFTGEAFARFMVRMLVGAMTAVSHRELSIDVFRRGLEQQEKFHCPTAPPDPLILWNVRYPEAVDPFTAEERASFPPGLEAELTYQLR